MFLIGVVHRRVAEAATKSLRFGQRRTIRRKLETLSRACLPRPMTELNSVGKPPIATDAGRRHCRPETDPKSDAGGMRFGSMAIPSDDSGLA